MATLTKQVVESLITQETYTRPNNGTLTVCVLTVEGGVDVVGNSNCINREQFSAEIGRESARADAFERLCELEGYHMKRAEA